MRARPTATRLYLADRTVLGVLIALAAYAAVYLAMAVFVDVALRNPPVVLVSVLALVGTRALVGLFYAAVPPTAAALVADGARPGHRAAVMARLGAANALGMAVGPAAAGWIAFHDLSLALYVAAALPLLSLLVVWWRLPLDGPLPGDTPRPPRQALTWRDPRLRLPIGAVFAAMVSVTIAQVVVGFFAIDRLGLSPADGARVAGLSLTAVGVGLMVSQMLVMRLKSVPPARWIALGAAISAIGFASLALIDVQWQLLLAYAVSSFGMGFVFPSFQALAADSVEAHEQGAAQGTVASVQGFGMVRSGQWRALFWPVCGLVIAAAIMNWPVHSPRQTHAFSYVNHAVALAEAQRYDEALHELDKAEALQPGDVDAHWIRAGVHFDLQNFDEALEHYQLALAGDPTFSGAHRGIGAVLVAVGKYAQAEQHFQAALELDPLDHIAMSKLAIIYTTRSEPLRALALLEKAAEIAPTDAQVQLNMGNVHLALRQFDAAIAAYEHALALDPQYVDAHLNLASVHAANGDFDSAIVHLRLALELQPDNNQAILTLVNLYVQSDRRVEAVEFLKRRIAAGDEHYQPLLNALMQPGP